MPQFDTSTFISQIFWLTICLGIVVFCYARIFIPKFNQTIEKRLSKIRYDVEQAEHMQERAKLLLDQSQKKLDDAQKQVEEHIKETLADFEAKKKLQLGHIDDELDSSLKAMSKSFERQQLVLREGMESLADECVQQIMQHVVMTMQPLPDSDEIAATSSSGGETVRPRQRRKAPHVAH